MEATPNDVQIREAFAQLVYAYRLKHTLRYHGSRDLSKHGESVAEHVFGLLFLAQYFLPLEDLEGRLDAAKVHQLLLFHDFPEIKHGDLPYHLKTPADEARERDAAKEVFDSLPAPLSAQAYQLWQEYEAQKTREAQFVYALDKIEPIFELADPVAETSLKRLQFTFEHNIHRKLKATENFPIMRRFVEIISEDMRVRGVFWKGPEDYAVEGNK